MNSLDKMEDYDRLKQERDELAAQVEVMREALMEAKTWNWLDEDPPPYEVLREVDIALSITPSAALREIQAITLDEVAQHCGQYADKLIRQHNAISEGQVVHELRVHFERDVSNKRKGE